MHKYCDSSACMQVKQPVSCFQHSFVHFDFSYYKEQVDQMSKTRQMGYFYLSWYDELGRGKLILTPLSLVWLSVVWVLHLNSGRCSLAFVQFSALFAFMEQIETLCAFAKLELKCFVFELSYSSSWPCRFQSRSSLVINIGIR